MPVEIARGLHDGLVIAFHVGKRCDQRLLQPGHAGLLLRQLLGQDQRGRPVALLEKRVEQQLLGHEIVRMGDMDRAELDDRFVISAGP